MSVKTQAKVLRALEEQAFERVGGKETLRVDVRVLAASNQNLPELIAQGRFREDLFYRLSVIPIEVPSLRQRTEDIPLLVEHFINLFSGENAKRPKTISVEALAYFLSYDWPGNVRELRNMVERLVIMTPGDVIGPEALPPPLTPAGSRRQRRGHPAGEDAQGGARGLRAGLHPGRAARARVEHDPHRREARHRAQPPLPQAQDVRHHAAQVAFPVTRPVVRVLRASPDVVERLRAAPREAGLRALDVRARAEPRMARRAALDAPGPRAPAGAFRGVPRLAPALPCPAPGTAGAAARRGVRSRRRPRRVPRARPPSTPPCRRP